MSKNSQSPSYQVSYSEYLHLSELLKLQQPESDKVGRQAHDENLFIIVHQVYELWFKQILHDLNSILQQFKNPSLADESLGICVSRLDRILRIQKLMLDQIDILETMTPMDFLDFRDLLYPASGFQSFQFRTLENLLGLQKETRLPFDNKSYINRIDTAHQAQVLQSEAGPSLFSLVEGWLERTPFLQAPEYSFWEEYQKAVERMLQGDEEGIRKNPFLDEAAKNFQLSSLAKTRESFEILYDAKKLEHAISEKRWRFSHKATLAALFIYLYRDEPALQLPFKMLSLLTDIDETMTLWRYRHSQMAMRMIGTKIGTGGSSGGDYLMKATQAHRVFADLTKLATFLIPRKTLPALPPSLKKQLAFHYQV